MQYEVAGRVLQSTDPKSQSSSFVYNAVGQPTSASLPGETVSYGYGLNGRTESVTDNRGATVPIGGRDGLRSGQQPRGRRGQSGDRDRSYTYRVDGERAW